MGIWGEFHNLLQNYLSDICKRVILIRQNSWWRPILAGVFSYINYKPNELKSNAKPFADNMSLFRIARDLIESANTLNNDPSLISKWDFIWKMLFNPDPIKPAQEELSSRKKKI